MRLKFRMEKKALNINSNFYLSVFFVFCLGEPVKSLDQPGNLRREVGEDPGN